MRFTPSIFGKLLEPIKRRQFDTLVARHAGDAYVKSFPSWNHLLALVYAQFSSATSLRGLEAGWNASRQHHYPLGSGPLVRSTLADANKRRPVAVFAETFGLLASQLDRQTRRDGTAMVKLIDSTPIPLGKLCDWAKSNGRIRGLKMHVVFDPKADCPSILNITDANGIKSAVHSRYLPQTAPDKCGYGTVADANGARSRVNSGGMGPDRTTPASPQL